MKLSELYVESTKGPVAGSHPWIIATLSDNSTLRIAIQGIEAVPTEIRQPGDLTGCKCIRLEDTDKAHVRQLTAEALRLAKYHAKIRL